MAKEIERKFLIIGPYRMYATKHSRIVQGYISKDPGRTVRIRTNGDKSYITIKGQGNEAGTSRFEWEREISHEDAKNLFQLCLSGIIEKIRYIIPFEGHNFEVDEFLGDNQGLCIGEIELSDENESFSKPSWLGKEVTGDRRYYNSYISEHPYKTWK